MQPFEELLMEFFMNQDCFQFQFGLGTTARANQLSHMGISSEILQIRTLSIKKLVRT